MTATADQQAAQNRLVRVNVRFTNKNKESDNFEKHFDSFLIIQMNNFGALNSALKKFLKEITQDILSH
jgi:hypothetical protein